MGEYLTVPMELVKPTENRLIANSLDKIMDSYLSFSRHLLPPLAVLSYNEEYWLLDGLHRTAIEVFMGAAHLRVYRVDHQEDILDWLSFPEQIQGSIIRVNTTIVNRFYGAVEHRISLQKSIPTFDSITSIQDYQKVAVIAELT